MSLIYREKLIDHLNACLAGSDGDTPITDAVIIAIRGYVEKVPAVDAVPVVRCGECGFAVDDCIYGLPNTIRCTFWGDADENICVMPKAGFCCYGERREEDGTES